GDGKIDLAASNYNGNNFSVLLGNGDGNFQTQQTYPTGTRPHFAASGDLNGDGRVDLVAGNQSDNTVSVLLGNGNGTFQVQVTYPVGLLPRAVSIADVNLDGRPDVLSANSSVIANSSQCCVSVLLGNGNGTF